MAGLQGADALAAWRANGGKPTGPRKPRTKAILMREMADAIGDWIVSKGKKLSREEKLQLVEDNMLDAAVAISQRLAKIKEEEDFTLTDTMAMFKQVREYQMVETRRSKIDPKAPKDPTPEGLKAYQDGQKADKVAYAAAPAPEEKPVDRVTAAGAPDKRHENKGRPQGQTLAKNLEKVRREQDKLRAKDAPDETEPTKEM